MDTGTPDLGPQLATEDAKRAAQIEKEIERVRGHLDGLVSELDHRRYRLSPLRVAREHPTVSALVGGLFIAALIGAGVLIYVVHARRQQSWLRRGRRLTQAFRQLGAGKPVETSPGIGWKILTAAGTATAAVVGRRLARRLFWPSKQE